VRRSPQPHAVKAFAARAKACRSRGRPRTSDFQGVAAEPPAHTKPESPVTAPPASSSLSNRAPRLLAVARRSPRSNPPRLRRLYEARAPASPPPAPAAERPADPASPVATAAVVPTTTSTQRRTRGRSMRPARARGLPERWIPRRGCPRRRHVRSNGARNVGGHRGAVRPARAGGCVVAKFRSVHVPFSPGERHCPTRPCPSSSIAPPLGRGRPAQGSSTRPRVPCRNESSSLRPPCDRRFLAHPPIGPSGA